MRNDRNNSSDNNRGGPRGGGGRNFNNRSFGNNRGSSDRQMHSAVCSTCSKDCQVPFRPSGDKPIYCNDCFGKNKNRDTGGRKSFDSRPPRHSDTGQNQQLNAINTKIDQILAILKPNEKTEAKKETEAPTDAPAPKKVKKEKKEKEPAKKKAKKTTKKK